VYPEQPQGGTPGYDPNQPPAWTPPTPPASVPPAGPPPTAQPGYPQPTPQPAAAPPAPGTAWSSPQESPGYGQQPAGYPQQTEYSQQTGYAQQPAGYPPQQPAGYPQQTTAYPQPASAPPGYPAGYPQPASAPPGYPQPAGYSQPTPARPGTRAFVVLIVVSAVLAVGLIATAAVGLTQMNKLQGDRDAVTAQRDAQKQKQNAAAAQLQQDFTSADLSGKLSKVKELDRAVDSAFHQFKAGSTKFGVLAQAMSDCDDAVDTYDQAAAKFPESMLTAKSLPQKIDVSNSDTDCGRSITQDI
jgi:hypothetical protein